MTATTSKIELNEISSVYSGRNGACCCGCAGKHTYASQHREWAGKNRGYEVTDDEVFDRTVKMIVSKINANIDSAEDVGDHVALVVGKRLYVAYRKHD